MEGLPVMNIIGGVLIYLAKFLFVLSSAIALYRKRSSASVLLLVGSISVLIADILGLFLITNAGRTSAEEVVKYTGVNSILTAITYIIFGLGLLLYVLSIQKSSTLEI